MNVFREMFIFVLAVDFRYSQYFLHRRMALLYFYDTVIEQTPPAALEKHMTHIAHRAVPIYHVTLPFSRYLRICSETS